MRTVSTLLAVVMVVGHCGCVVYMPSNAVEGSGAVTAQQRQIGDFDGIVLYGDADLDVQVGKSTSVTVTIDDNLLELIQTEVYGGRLVIKNLRSYRSEHGLHVGITVPRLTYLDIAGAGDVQIDNLQSDDFELQISGAGDVFGHGAARDLSVQINGSGNVDFSDLTATDASVTINRSGDVQVHAVERLSATIHGSGDIRYRGSPVVERSILGSGDIEQLPE